MTKKAEAATWFAGRLRELREASGLTQQQLGDIAGFTRDGIAQLETGRGSPTWDTVLAICSALKVSCEEFRKAPAPAAKKGPGRPPKQQPIEGPAPTAAKKGRRKRKAAEPDENRDVGGEG